MSVTKDGQSIQCDGVGCNASVRLPVGLRPVLTRERLIDAEHAAGWLFASKSGSHLHYCPACKAAFLMIVVEDPATPDRNLVEMQADKQL